MCGRYANFSSAAAKAAHFDYPDWPEGAAHFNIAPSTRVEVLRLRSGSSADASRLRERCVDYLQWGLVPYWAKDKAIAFKTINARIETAHTSPTFRSAFFARRCLVVADGYYEWQKTPAGKQPYFICMQDRGVFAFGGLWERWRGPDGDLHSCSILTKPTDAPTRDIHDRMPVIIQPENYQAWLAPKVDDVGAIRALIASFPAEPMRAYPVSPRVNDARVDDARIIEPLSDAPLTL